ncbi:MAG: DNA translocase FtsK 4TM domain-containing protein [Caldilineaceae bacterium]|nr:DNA translocase FtsK 4TM domain-containing protein [Caldilineaceae bacterium]
MAKSRGKKSKKQDGGGLFGSVSALLRGEIIGVALMLIALFTLLSLITNSRGLVTDAWISGLQSLFGVGVWLFPFLTAGIGFWFIRRAFDPIDDLPWQRPAGMLLLFVALIMGAGLYAGGESPEQGGTLGAMLADLFRTTITPAGAWAFVTFLFIAGLLFLTERLLLDYILDFWYAVQGWTLASSTGPSLPDQSPVILPRGEIPWWKRMADRFRGGETRLPPVTLPASAPGNMVTPEPQSPTQRGAAPTQERPASRGGNPAPVQAGAKPRDEELLAPRIVGDQNWRLPRRGDILRDWERFADSDDRIREQGRLIQDTLASFGVPADFEGAYKGPAVTQYLIKPGYIERTIRGELKRQKVKVSKISNLANDLALALAAPSVRIEAPIPGTTYVGVEVPNEESNVVGLKELMDSETFLQRKGKLILALGEDVKGQPIVTDLTKMPHLLIAGATGSGKSVCINSIITALLLTHTPDSLRLLMVDPKMVELSVYNGVPHLLTPVVTEVDKAAGVLFWAVKEMERRYQLLSKVNARDLERYNAYLTKRNEKPLPYIVIVVDEMADLMMAAPEEVEKHICRLAQMARAVGIHLIIATQRPSVDVITGLIKANFPARIAFAVTSQTDSRVILDIPGAERLLGRGDMLFMAPDASKLERLQGTFLGDDEINNAVRYWKGTRSLEEPVLRPEAEPAAPTRTDDAQWREAATAPVKPVNGVQVSLFDEIDELKSIDARDELYDDAVRVVQEAGRGSVSLLQRKLRIGYSRAARLVEQLEEAGILGPDLGGSQGREYLGESQSGSRPHIIGGDDSDSYQVWM